MSKIEIPQRSSLLPSLRCAILSVGGADRAHLDSGPPGLPRGDLMKRREFITLVGSTVIAWPLAARAQQSAMPIAGFLGVGSPDKVANGLRAFHQGLGETGFVGGRNVATFSHSQGQSRPRQSKPHEDVCPLHPKSGPYPIERHFSARWLRRCASRRSSSRSIPRRASSFNFPL